jgi:hypothetical protein
MRAILFYLKLVPTRCSPKHFDLPDNLVSPRLRAEVCVQATFERRNGSLPF